MKTRKRTKTTEITVEKSEVFVVRKVGRSSFAWCPECSARVRMLTPEEAARASGLSTRAIYRGVENGWLHFSETRQRLVMVCSASLITFAQTEPADDR